PMKGITLFIFGGVAEMGGEPANPRVEFEMAAVGPLASAIIGLAAYFVFRAGEASWPAPVVGGVPYPAWVNWMLAVFNLIPAFPLDGGRIFRSIVWHFKGDLTSATRIASRIGGGFGVLLIALGLFSLIFGNFVSAVWYVVLGMFLRAAAQQAYQQVILRSA